MTTFRDAITAEDADMITRMLARGENPALPNEGAELFVTAGFSPTVETYSVDETFLDLSGSRGAALRTLCQDMRGTVRRWTGIPTCVGIGPTKTLAKLGNAAAKKHAAFGGVCDLSAEGVEAYQSYATADLGIGGWQIDGVKHCVPAAHLAPVALVAPGHRAPPPK